MKAKDARKNGAGNGPKMVSATVKLPTDLLVEVDARRRSMDLSRSQYFRRLARRDLETPEAA